MPSRRYRSKKRHTPTRMPYSCYAQFGTSGNSTWPVGAGRTCRAIGREMFQTSRLTIVQTTMRAPPGRRNGGRSTIAENGGRSRGVTNFLPCSLCGGGAGGLVGGGGFFIGGGGPAGGERGRGGGAAGALETGG